jgi:hypothetical protein
MTETSFHLFIDQAIGGSTHRVDEMMRHYRYKGCLEWRIKCFRGDVREIRKPITSLDKRWPGSLSTCKVASQG